MVHGWQSINGASVEGNSLYLFTPTPMSSLCFIVILYCFTKAYYKVIYMTVAAGKLEN